MPERNRNRVWCCSLKVAVKGYEQSSWPLQVLRGQKNIPLNEIKMEKADTTSGFMVRGQCEANNTSV